MKCPLIAIGYLGSERIDATEKCICGEAECAWWDELHGRCAVTTIAVQLGFARADLKNIAKELTLSWHPEK